MPLTSGERSGARLSGGPEIPLVSIVTPSLNAAPFIEETIESVLAQDYPRIEYIVMDGGSTDGTLEILERYRGRLQYSVQKDEGTADAVNSGFRRSRGGIFAWLSADDVYLPGAVSRAVSRFSVEPDAAVVYGEGYWIDEKGGVIGGYPTKIPFDPTMFAGECCVCQPCCFIRRDAFESVGMLDARLHSAFDYDLWMRLARDYRFFAVPEYFASSRMHRSNKSLGQRRLMFEESMMLLRRHYGYVPVNWVYGYLSFLRDRRDQFLEPLRQSGLTWLASLPVGSYYNHARLWRYWSEWSLITLNGLRKIGKNP
jgi:glycosyltransferase involved in cell wall biosynthesis